MFQCLGFSPQENVAAATGPWCPSVTCGLFSFVFSFVLSFCLFFSYPFFLFQNPERKKIEGGGKKKKGRKEEEKKPRNERFS